MSVFTAVATRGSTDLEDAVFHPLTPAEPSWPLLGARLTVWKNGSGFEYAPGAQYSSDGITWSDAPGVLSDYNGSTPDAWETTTDREILTTWMQLPSSMETLSNTSGTTLTARLYIRFGVFVKNTSGTSVQRGEMAATVERYTTEGAVFTATPQSVSSGGGSNTFFTPLTDKVANIDLSYLRISWNVSSDSGVDTKPAVQTSDDGINWNAATDLSSDFGTQSGDGNWFGTSFENAMPSTGRYVRFGVLAVNTTTSNAAVLGARVGMRIEARRSN